MCVHETQTHTLSSFEVYPAPILLASSMILGLVCSPSFRDSKNTSVPTERHPWTRRWTTLLHAYNRLAFYPLQLCLQSFWVDWLQRLQFTAVTFESPAPSSVVLLRSRKQQLGEVCSVPRCVRSIGSATNWAAGISAS